MIRLSGGVDPAKLGFSSLFNTFLEQGRLEPYLVGGRHANWQEAASRADRLFASQSRERWNEVVDDIRALSRRSGAGEELLDKLDRARDGGVYFVVTGQQPGVLGGPLHTAYKIATAIAVADDLERELNAPVIPLYWCGTDDTDFPEIKALYTFAADYSPVQAKLSAKSYRNGLPVGDIEVSAVAEVWKTIRPFLEGQPAETQLVAIIDAALESAADHGQATAGVLCRWFQGRIAVTDARFGSVRRFAQDMFVRFAESEERWRKMVDETGGRLEQLGFHAQLQPGDTSNIFLMEDGLRKSVGIKQRATLLEAVRSRVEDCAPGVIVRNLVQDYSFRPLGVVLGPGEVAYRAQISGLFKEFDVPSPAIIPRITATFIPPPFTEMAEEVGYADALVMDPKGCRTLAFEHELPDEVRNIANHYRKTVAEAGQEFVDKFESVAPDKLAAKLKARVSDMRGRMENVAEIAYGLGKARALERWPHLVNLEHVIRPGDGLQERRVWSGVPFSCGAEQFGRDLVDAAASSWGAFVDGTTTHIVYSECE